MKNLKPSTKGFTVLELIIVIAIFALVYASSTLVFGDIFGRNSLRYYGYQMVQDFREARSNASSQKHDSDWGLYFDDASVPHSYTFFRGSSYATRDSSYDRTLVFPKVVTFETIDFSEVVFTKSSAEPDQTGDLLISTPTQSYSLTLNSLGIVDYEF